MAKTALEQWDETAANNLDRGGVNIAEGCNPSDINNAMRELMSQVAKWLGDDTIASAATTDLGSVPGRYVEVTGTTTITGFGTIKAGTVKYVKFAGALTLTHDDTSLILPGAVNIPTAAGDTAIFVSEGSGNWRCLGYQRASYASPTITPWVAFTPVFTSFGTVSAVSMWSRRVGDTMEVRGKFTSGIATAGEARMTILFNGATSVVSDATKVPSIMLAGNVIVSSVSARALYAMIESGVAHLTFSISSGGREAFSKVGGSDVAISGNVVGVQAAVPISGW